MKKTLIALAVAASAVVSGSAMAEIGGWSQGSTGNDVILGGTLTPVTKVVPWYVTTGTGYDTALNAQIAVNSKVANILLEKRVSVLGIRANKSFMGEAGIEPQISYGGKVDIDGFGQGQTTLTLDVMSGGKKIGTLTSPFWAASLAVWKKQGTGGDCFSVYAPDNTHGFFGGVGKSVKTVTNDAWLLVEKVFPEAQERYETLGISVGNNNSIRFNDPNTQYDAFYGSGIKSGSTIKITLDSPAPKGAEIAWTATLPVQVSYN